MRARLRSLGQRVSLREGLFPAQRAFVGSDERLRAAICGRRAGKSHAYAVALLDRALEKPETLSVYIAISRGHARRIMWSKLTTIAESIGLEVEPHLTDLSLQLPNGSSVWLTGCPDRAHIETFRGPSYARVVIDEAASFPRWLDDLTDDVLLPALADHQGDMMITGTPGVAPVGLLYRVDHGDEPGWGAVHRWTMLDNRAIPHAAEEMEFIRARKGWTKNHPTFQREYLGRWIADRSMLVYSGVSKSSIVGALPPLRGSWTYVLGVDLGASQSHPTTALSLIAASDETNMTVMVESRAFAGFTPTRLAEEIKRWRAKYSPVSIVMDAGALGVGYIRELRLEHNLPVKPATKSDKRGFIEQLNGAYLTGRAQIIGHGCRDLLDEIEVLPWHDEDREKERDGAANHCCDSHLYAWREAKRLTRGVRPAPEPKPAGSEFEQAAESRAKKRRRRR